MTADGKDKTTYLANHRTTALNEAPLPAVSLAADAYRAMQSTRPKEPLSLARAGSGLAEAATGDADVWIDRWSLKRNAAAYTAKIDAEDFPFDLTLAETQTVLLNGDAGVSRKGPAAEAASYYYSLPHLRVAGAVTRQDKADRATGEARFDHEWSSEYLDAQAVGWDSIGTNLEDGAALMAFRIRGAQGEQRWAGGTLRGSDGHVQILARPMSIFAREGSGHRRERELPTPYNGMCAREPESSISSRCSTIRRTTLGSRPAPSIGKVRFELSSSAKSSVVSIWN